MEEEWSSDANEALELSLLSPSTGKQITTFQPSYTYSIFGESETVFGYKGLEMHLGFAANDMRPCFDVSWEERMQPKGSVTAEDVEEVVKEFLPKGYEKDLKEFETSIRERSKLSQKWTPPGEVISEYVLHGKQYEIWHSSVADPRCKELLHNIQILVLLYIEGGSFINLDDEEWTNQRWEVFFLYEKTPSSYTFIGYCTCYRYFLYNTTDSNFSRIRISQFLILPPFQRMGHGGTLYDRLITHFHTSPNIHEITVEDPSESFQDLRDVQDLNRLVASGALKGLSTSSIANKTFPASAIRAEAKLPERQFARMLELKLLQGLDKRDKRGYKGYRLLVKGRIYKQNRDVLSQLDRLDRIDKLHDTYIHVEDDYYRLLKIIGTSRVVEVDEAEGKGVAGDKRRGESGNARPSKRVKVMG